MGDSRRLIQARHLLLACFWALPLFSLTRVEGLPWVYVASLVAVVLWTIWRPAVGLLLLAILLPLGFAFVSLAGLPFNAARAIEGLLLALLVGWSLHVVFRSEHLQRTLLGLPVTSLAIIIAASAIVAALAQFGAVDETARQLWRQLTQHYMAGPLPPQPLAVSLRWLEVLALALVAERIVHLAKPWAPLILMSWLGAGAAVAAQTVVNVARIALGQNIGWDGAIATFRSTRFGAVYPDINGAGSIFALLFLTALLFAAARRRWLFGVVAVPVLLVALIGTQSRAALAATLVAIAVLIVLALVRKGRRVVGYGLAAAVIAVAVPVVMARGETHVSAGAALSSRVEMWQVALKISAEDPVFGTGAGRFQTASRDYLTEAFIATFPEAASGENAHNNLLQVLAEFGLTGFIAFVWLLVAALRPSTDAPDPDRRALLAGLGAFLFSAMFGHPLLIYELAVVFFFALGLAAGLGSQPLQPPRLWHWALIAFVLVSFPWRAIQALAPPIPDVVGATEAAEPLDGQPYFVAGETSRWRLRTRTRAALIPMRWAEPADANCRVRIAINGRDADEVSLEAGKWVPVPLIVPPGTRLSVQPELELRVAPATCKLLVGKMQGWR